MINNEFAYGFNNLTLKARFNKLNYTNCEWVIDGKDRDENEIHSTVIFNSFGQCKDIALCYEEDVGDAVYINTNLTISEPITFDPRVSIVCNQFHEIFCWKGFSKSKFLRFCFAYSFLDFLITLVNRKV